MLANEEQKVTVLRNAHKLKNEANHQRRTVGIAPDMTRRQREHEYYLRQEIRERRAQGETGLYIKNGRLCRAREEGRWRRY